MKLVHLDYTNWRRERKFYSIVPVRIFFGSNNWHPTPQWLLEAWDKNKDRLSTFSCSTIHSWQEDDLLLDKTSVERIRQLTNPST